MKGAVIESSEDRNWAITAGIQLRVAPSSLKPIFTNSKRSHHINNDEDLLEDQQDCCPTTPTSEESRIPVPAKRPCPPAPRRKKRPSLRCNHQTTQNSTATAAAKREYFNVPHDLETVFIPRHIVD